MDVVRQRLQRRNVDDLRRIGEPALEALPHQIVDRGKKGGERLARSGRRGDERVAAGLDRGPGFGLRGRGRGESVGEPARDRRMEQGFDRGRRSGRGAGVGARAVARLRSRRSRRASGSGSPRTPRKSRPSSIYGRIALWSPSSVSVSRIARLPNAATCGQGSARSAKPGKAHMTSQTQPTVALNDGATMPQFGLGVFQTPPDTTEQVVKMAVERRLSPGRHGVDVSKRGGRRRGPARPDRRLRDHEARQFGSRLRRSAARIRRQHEKAAPRQARSLFDPLAAPARQSLCRKLEGARSSAKGRAGPLDRRLELQSRSPRTDHRRDGRHARGQPDRASSAVSAARLARVSRRGRDQDGIVEPARSGRALERARDRRHRRQASARRRRRSSFAGISTAA